MGVIRKDLRGGQYVKGRYGTHYLVVDVASIDHHIAVLAKDRCKRRNHPDFDALLDARLELAAAT